MPTVKFQRTEPAIDAFKAKLGEGLIAAVLYGSHARGEGGRTSDWDLFMIAEGLPENPFDRQLALRALLPREAAGVSIVAKTREEFETSFPPLYLDLAVDGIVLYDPGGYMQGKLHEIRGIIERAGLRACERISSGLQGVYVKAVHGRQSREIPPSPPFDKIPPPPPFGKGGDGGICSNGDIASDRT